ncbi:selenide, water dikinase SelD [soil metagenome]
MDSAPHDFDVLVDARTFDDAGVYRIAPDLALIQTVDFFTPIVDDARDFGEIAAANALSDVYAMGGTPRTALALVCWPPSGLAPEILGRILAGGAEKCREAACSIIGGHSIQDEELKYGLAVTGTAHPDRLMTNAGARPGDVLILTKALGTGVLTTALKNGALSQADIRIAVESMKRLSATAAELALEAGVRAATDVTGFGLIGHAVHLADASAVTLELEAGALPLFERVEELALAGHVPGGGRSNRAYFEPRAAIAPDVTEGRRLAAFDPQTSGGLLLAVSRSEEAALLHALRMAEWTVAERIGTVLLRGEHAVEVR